MGARGLVLWSRYVLLLRERISFSEPFSWGRSELTDRNVELYPQFFLELITTQLRFYMVSPQLSLLIILTMQSYKFYVSVFVNKNAILEITSNQNKETFHVYCSNKVKGQNKNFDNFL